jgi:alcohol dehydrogenase
MVGMTRPGAFAQFMSIPASSLIDIPQDMPAVTAALTEPAATALHAINLSMRAMTRPMPEGKTLIIGGGAIGILSALLLKHYGVQRLTILETNPLRRETLATELPDAQILDPRTTNPQESSFDYVMDAVGSKITRETAFKCAKPGGVIMHVGLQDWASEIDMRKLTLAEITLLGTYTYNTADLRATVDLLAQGAFGKLGWVQSLPLDQGAIAFDSLHRGLNASSKVVLIP